MRPLSVAREEVAYHEAGHAIAALALGVSFEKVSIEPDDESHGRVHGFEVHEDELDDLDFLKRHIVITIAGPLAAARSLGEPDCEPLNNDREAIVDMLIRACGDPEALASGAAYKKYEERADRILDARWADVERLAVTLLGTETMAFGEVMELVAR